MKSQRITARRVYAKPHVEFMYEFRILARRVLVEFRKTARRVTTIYVAKQDIYSSNSEWSTRAMIDSSVMVEQEAFTAAHDSFTRSVTEAPFSSCSHHRPNFFGTRPKFERR